MVVVGLAAGLIALGVVALPQMHADVLPELSQGPVLEVQTEALGLSSQEVEQYITVPMENNLLDGVMGVWDVRSQSVPGLSAVDLYFEPGTTMLHARQLVEERLTNAFSLPNVAKPPLLIQPLSSTSRALMIGLRSTTIDPLELSYLARWVVKPRLSGVPGVANVAIFGQQDRQIQVQVDPARLASHHISLQQIIDTAGDAQLVSPLTYLQGSSPGTGGFLDGPNQRLEIRPVLPLGAPKDLAAVPVTDAPGSPPLGSLTDVVPGHQPLIGDGLGSQGSELVLLIQKLPSASVLGVTKGVQQALAELAPALQGVTIDTSFFRPASYVSNALGNLELALGIAAALGILALGALLFDARAAFLAALSVGLSLLVAVLVLEALGYTLNALVVLGLLLASAVLVDDAVAGALAIVASVQERGESGEPVPIQARIALASAQLRGGLGYGTLIVLLSIAPVFFAKGLTATFLHPMALAFALAVVASMVIAFTFTPALGMLLFERGGSRRHATSLVARIGAGYESIVERALQIPRGAVACVCVIGLAGGIAFPFVKQPSPPRFIDRNLVVQWDGPAGAGLTEMNRITSRVIGYLRALPSVSDVAATLGRAVSADQIVDTSSGQIYVALKPSADYDSSVNAVRAVVQSVPGMHASVSTYESDVEAGVLAPADHDLTVRVYGEDYTELQSLANHVRGLMRSISGLGPPQVQLPAQEPSIQVAVNDAAALRAGVLPGDARRQASTLVSGLTVGNFFEDQAVFDVVVIGVPALRASVDDVRNMLIDTAGGGHVRLGSIASVTVQSGPIDIEHEALSRYLDVTAPVDAGGVGAAGAVIQRDLSRISFPLDYHAELVGGTPDSPTSHAKFLSFVLAAAVGVLLLLQAAFGSWRLAALFLLALPASLVGGVLVALATGEARSLGADAGLLAVFAFASRQGMLQIIRIRRLHAEGGGELTAELVLRAAREGFMPSLTAVLVIAAALVPFVVIGDVAGNEITHTAAAVILGGLVSSTLLIELLVPAICLAFGPSEAVAVEQPIDDLTGSSTVPTPSTRVS